MTKHERSSRYRNRPGREVSINRAVIQDESLSSDARFLYCLMRSFDGWVRKDGDRWHFDDRDLMRRCGWRDPKTLYRYRNELVEAGLVSRIRITNELGYLERVDWDVMDCHPDPTETPPGEEPQPGENPNWGKTPPRGNPYLGKNPNWGKTPPHKQGINPYSLEDLKKAPHTPHRGASDPGKTDPSPNQEPEGGSDLDEQSVIEDDQDLNRDPLNGDGSASPRQESPERGLEDPGRPVSTSSGRTTYPEEFEAVWKAYNKFSGSKLSAFNAWKKVRKAFPDLDVQAAIERFVRRKEAEDAEECRRRGEDPRDRRRFWKDLSSWLNGRCWETEPVVAEGSQAASQDDRKPDCHRHRPMTRDEAYQQLYRAWRDAPPKSRLAYERNNEVPGAIEYCHEQWAQEPPELHERYRQRHGLTVGEGV